MNLERATNHMNRRAFLKFTGLLGGASILRQFQVSTPKTARWLSQNPAPNIILLLYDSLSARHLSLYGYKRHTSPNLERFAHKATVFHNHHSAGNYTTPSTASLFTGKYSWVHRAINLGGLVSSEIASENLFTQLCDKSGYRGIAYTQNILADLLIYQATAGLTNFRHVSLDSFTLAGQAIYTHLSDKEAIQALYAYDQFLFKREEQHGSLFLSILRDLGIELDLRMMSRRREDKPVRISSTDLYYDFSDTTDGVIDLLSQVFRNNDQKLGANQPFLAYIHLMPPHAPYHPSQSFRGKFADGWTPLEKPKHRLASNLDQEYLNTQRQLYDEYVANVDGEFGRILDYLEISGLLDNSLVIFTSDHGELFERGEEGHATPLLYEPVIHVPLLISYPGQQKRRDIFGLTCNVDLSSSIFKFTMPQKDLFENRDWLETGSQPGERIVFALEAKKMPAFATLGSDGAVRSMAAMDGRYKLIHYQGYSRALDRYEFYDVEKDPEELENLIAGGVEHPKANELKQALFTAIQGY